MRVRKGAFINTNYAQSRQQKTQLPHEKQSENGPAKYRPQGRGRVSTGIAASATATDGRALPRPPDALDEVDEQTNVAQQKHAVTQNETDMRVPLEQVFKALLPQSN